MKETEINTICTNRENRGANLCIAILFLALLSLLPLVVFYTICYPGVRELGAPCVIAFNESSPSLSSTTLSKIAPGKALYYNTPNSDFVFFSDGYSDDFSVITGYVIVASKQSLLTSWFYGDENIDAKCKLEFEKELKSSIASDGVVIDEVYWLNADMEPMSPSECVYIRSIENDVYLGVSLGASDNITRKSERHSFLRAFFKDNVQR